MQHINNAELIRGKGFLSLMVHSKNDHNYRQKQLKREKKKRQRNLRLIFFCLCLLLLIVGLNSGFSNILGLIADVAKVDAVDWEMAVPGEVWIFQQEVLVSSKQRGSLEPVVKQGERVAKGGLVAKVRYFEGTSLSTQSNELLSSPVAGIVAYEADGLELVDTQERFAQLTIDAIARAIAAQVNTQAADQSDESSKSKEGQLLPNQVAAGDVVFKVTDNLSDCYLFFKTDQDVDSWFEADKTILLQAEDGSKGYAVMKEKQALADGNAVLLKLNSGLEKQRLSRQVPIKIIVERQDKAAVPVSAVITKNDTKGVFIYKDGYVNWRPVSIVEENDKQVIVEGIEADEWVVLRPWLARDGMRLKIKQ